MSASSSPGRGRNAACGKTGEDDCLLVLAQEWFLSCEVDSTPVASLDQQGVLSTSEAMALGG